MSIWKDQAPSKTAPPPVADPLPFQPAAAAAPVESAPATPATTPTPTPVARPSQPQGKESLIASDLTIEGKIEGTGHVRIAGKFKGDVNVQGDLTIEVGAKLAGSVRASKVVVAGELEGNIEAATQVELLASGMLVGDVKAGSLTVAAGARMRGQVDFGWSDKDGRHAKADQAPKADKSEA
ncbi:bactofilin family protein [Pseudoxanthomonas composti]|uniref:Polymer-forming cytoskeletal protein n=1 Tax=Pseudoxanthomonas composti TaxID=2137479 RepID=A0A4V1N1C3_9GAMM|nr:polymer-forming cytoskeletal protein [Pseudoxanthomonas composti]RXR07149.1 polymer-forming cytoskeletal protein [Pseudoxanthomonas composti]